MPYNTVIINVPDIVRRAGVHAGFKIADFGTGREGRMALASGQVIGENGVAYAVDVVKNILPTVMTKAKMHGINNVETVWSDLEVYGATRAIADNVLDVGFLVTTLFQSQKRVDIMRECYRMIKPGGRLVVVDWQPNANAPLGPPHEVCVAPEEVKKYAADLGMQLMEEFKAGDYHWGLIFIK